jgi:hypothetical protein
MTRAFVFGGACQAFTRSGRYGVFRFGDYRPGLARWCQAGGVATLWYGPVGSITLGKNWRGLKIGEVWQVWWVTTETGLDGGEWQVRVRLCGVYGVREGVVRLGLAGMASRLRWGEARQSEERSGRFGEEAEARIGRAGPVGSGRIQTGEARLDWVRHGLVGRVRRGSSVSPRLGEAGEARLGHTRSGTNWSGWAGFVGRGRARSGASR